MRTNDSRRQNTTDEREQDGKNMSHLRHALPDPCLAMADSSPSKDSFALNSFDRENAEGEENGEE